MKGKPAVFLSWAILSLSGVTPDWQSQSSRRPYENNTVYTTANVPGWRNGRREGLKIPYPLSDVWVQFPPSAPLFFLFYKAKKSIELHL